MRELLSAFYSRTHQSDHVVVEAKLEICKTLHLIYDMYTDLRIKTLVARYRELFDEWITYTLWRKKGDDGHPLKPFEESMPFDKPPNPNPNPNPNPTPSPNPSPNPNPNQESMPFDKPDEEGKLPKELHELYKVSP